MRFPKLLRDDRGATAIEYSLIAALISVALIAGASALGTSLNNQFTGLSKKMNIGADGKTGTAPTN